jgi:histidinol-phosphate/aromatic aminotransferase/cobyric acid decarboxylase-like protein
MTAASGSEPHGQSLQDGYFEPDQYEEINARYFEDILRSHSWAALPAGWHNPSSAGALNFRERLLSSDELQRYALDEGFALRDDKAAVLSLLADWERSTLEWDQVTLCSSVSTANLVVLGALRERQIDTIIFETPAYYGTLEQARLLGFRIVRIPTFRHSAFGTPLDTLLAAVREDGRHAFWFTQPRFGVGIDQNVERLQGLAEALSSRDILVFDEAAEQKFPSVLSALGPTSCDIIRTRGMLKGVGLNGLRLSAIIHPKHWRAEMQGLLESAGASLDRFSLVNAADLAKTPELLPRMLAAANSQVIRLRKSLAVLTVGSWAEPTFLENAYIGSILLDFRSLPGTYQQKRTAFLEYCREVRLPVILRCSIGFAYDPDWEALRINYFTPDDNVDRAGRLILEGFEGVRYRLRNCG